MSGGHLLAAEKDGGNTMDFCKAEIVIDPVARTNKKGRQKGRSNKTVSLLFSGNGMILVMPFFRFVNHRVMLQEECRCSCS